MKLTSGVVIAGKYRLERPLATGGMSALWVGHHLHLDVQVALKFMDKEGLQSNVARARFEREARASATLRNQHVVQVLDYGVEDDVPYLVMELLEGEDLGKRLRKSPRLPLADMAVILTQVAKGLRTAHEARVVHRDLKPANIFLARIHDDEVAKIVDFGIAKETGIEPIGESTKTGELMGSPHYMSPEQVRGAKDIDHRSDLWSLAVIAFRALTGRLPFDGAVIGAVIAQILADPIPRATEIAPDLPPEIDAFFARGFARDREQRFQSAREMAERFAVLAGAPIPSGRWTIAPDQLAAAQAALDEPPTRPQMPSNHNLVASDLAGPVSAPPPSARAPFPSLPMGPTSSVPAGTGGPVTQTAPPPAQPRSPSRAWYGAAAGGALVGVVVGVAAFTFSHKRSAPLPEGAPAPASSGPIVMESAAPPMETAAPIVQSAATAEPAPEVMTPEPAQSAAPAKTSAPVKQPGPMPPRPSGTVAPVKKKPSWGF